MTQAADLEEELEVERLLAESADGLFTRHAGVVELRELASGGWLPQAWAAAEEIGLPLIGLDEDRGGAGGSIAHAATVVQAAGRHAAQIPLASTMLATWMLGEVGVAVPAGPGAVARSENRGEQIAGDRVPYGRHLSWFVLLAPDCGDWVLRLASAASCQVSPGVNVASEPRDRVVTPRDGDQPWRPVPPSVVASLELRAALLRSAELVGALETVQRLVIDHVNQRVQFGRPLARFPVVRDRLALIVEEVAAARAVVDVARCALGAGLGELAVPAAKVRTAEAAGTVARLAHQLHGAIGTAAEHPLHFFTRRLWAWRDEDGDEQHWIERLGLTIVALGPSRVWGSLVDEDVTSFPPRSGAARG
jgi:acyl-CoA dehydrogenase